jgi:hypothetical protein
MQSVHTLTRRNALLSGLSLAAAPAIIGSTDKSGSRKPVAGYGEHTYEVHHDWGELPPQLAYGNTHGVCVDASGYVYVFHTVGEGAKKADAMVVFDEKGKFARSWAPEFKGGAHGLTLSNEGGKQFLFLGDTARAVVIKTTLGGEKVLELGYPKESPAYAPGPDGKLPKYSPTNVAIGPNGDIYVADGYGSHYINQYDSQGKFIRSFGGKGKEPGKVDCPHGIAIDARGSQPLVLVADRSNRRLQYFTLDGQHHSFSAYRDVRMPCHFDERKGVMLIPDLEARVTLLDKDNHVIYHLGEDGSNTWGQLRKEPRDKFSPGHFICPHGACFDRKGNIFVVEWVEVGRVTFLRKV